MWGRWKFPAGCPPSPQAAGAPWGWDTPNGVIMSPVPHGDGGHPGVQPSCSSSVFSVRRAGRSPRAASRGGIQGCCCICPHPWARSWCPHPEHSPQRAGTRCIHAASPRRAAAKGHGPRCPLPKPLPQKDACLHCDPFKGCPSPSPLLPFWWTPPTPAPCPRAPKGAGHLPKPVASFGLGQPHRILRWGRAQLVPPTLQWGGVWVAWRQGAAFGGAALYPGGKTVLKPRVSLTGGGDRGHRSHIKGGRSQAAACKGHAGDKKGGVYPGTEPPSTLHAVAFSDVPAKGRPRAPPSLPPALPALYSDRDTWLRFYCKKTAGINKKPLWLLRGQRPPSPRGCGWCPARLYPVCVPVVAVGWLRSL